MKYIIKLTTIIVFIIVSSVSATIINIPDDYATIQEGINSSSNGDTVLAQPGTYVENINFNGHNIILASLFLTTADTAFISSTIIDGNSTGKVVTFESNENSDAIITGFTIQNGHSDYGGGIFCDDSNPVINNNIISGNSVVVDGGGIFCINNSAPMIRNNIIYGNSTTCCGGGICCWLNSNPVICYNVIMNNSVIDFGGGISLLQSSPILSNNTIIGNSAGYGGGIGNVQSNPTIINTILREDSASREGHEIFIVYSSPSVTYCNVQGGWTGQGNIDADPMFVDPDNGDFHLLAGSPCIDAGDPDSPLDPDSTRADIGAFYFDQLVDIDDLIKLPSEFYLRQNYPNPFNLSTTISFNLSERSNVIIDIYDVLGSKVTTILDDRRAAGSHQVIWRADDLSSGVYFYKLQAGAHSESKKMVLIK